jgi:DNA-directed RNA polymerase subunit RPC12/RpoP
MLIKIKSEKEGFKCERCGHEWLPRSNEKITTDNLPVRCPYCNSPYWNKPRKNKFKKLVRAKQC